MNISEKMRINDKIRGKEFRIIGADGEQLGVMSAAEALEIAAGQDLDLVEIAANAKPPVCKIMNFGKYRYEQERKAKEAKKNQKQTIVKEVKVTARIDVHDLDTKVNQIQKFLEKDNKVKVTLVLFGREKCMQVWEWELWMRLQRSFRQMRMWIKNMRKSKNILF
ncbi:translation initiation factor IF-3 [Fusobacterium necrophorum subsp. funduliforme 1_1_36S]|nr:translation initiation factor IF-3 [Fusobacterium necrophorum subsp. funduliforme 1_1_36S]